MFAAWKLRCRGGGSLTETDRPHTAAKTGPLTAAAHTKLIGYARVSTKAQDSDRQVLDLLATGVRRDDLYIDHGVGGARASRPGFNRALEALHDGDTLVITTLDRLGRSTVNMLGLSEELKARG